jgi:hypothetical protein
MNDFFWFGFIVIGISICIISACLWIKMIKKNRTFPDLIEDLQQQEEEENSKEKGV